MVLGPPMVLVMRPAVPGPPTASVEAGLPKVGVLVAVYSSQRSSRRACSAMRKPLLRVRSNCFWMGPRIRLRTVRNASFTFCQEPS